MKEKKAHIFKQFFCVYKRMRGLIKFVCKKLFYAQVFLVLDVSDMLVLVKLFLFLSFKFLSTLNSLFADVCTREIYKQTGSKKVRDTRTLLLSSLLHLNNILLGLILGLYLSFIHTVYYFYCKRLLYSAGFIWTDHKIYLSLKLTLESDHISKFWNPGYK